jgi:hypothetical protein
MHSVPSRQHTFFVSPPLLIAVRSISHRTPTAPLGTKTGQVRLSESGVTSKSHWHNLLIPWPNGLFDGFQQLAIIDGTDSPVDLGERVLEEVHNIRFGFH